MHRTNRTSRTRRTIHRVCIIGASGRLGQYMIEHALERGYEVVGVCRPESVAKLERFAGRITVVPGRTDDREVIRRAVAGCDGVLTVLVPWGVERYASGTAQAVLDLAAPDARLVFSCGWHISRDGEDVYPWTLRLFVRLFGAIGRLLRVVDLDDQVAATDRIFASDRRWTVVRGSDLEEGESQGLPVWSRHVGDPILASNRTRRIDFGLFMVAALEDDALVREAPAICGRETASARRHADAAQLGLAG
ncbi:MAG: NAD(P)H-binding protein [Myxococcales bacterium]|nr:NAD(P)H-binding protein [Myxococcales bacterium]